MSGTQRTADNGMRPPCALAKYGVPSSSSSMCAPTHAQRMSNQAPMGRRRQPLRVALELVLHVVRATRSPSPRQPSHTHCPRGAMMSLGRRAQPVSEGGPVGPGTPAAYRSPIHHIASSRSGYDDPSRCSLVSQSAASSSWGLGSCARDNPRVRARARQRLDRRRRRWRRCRRWRARRRRRRRGARWVQRRGRGA